MVMFLSCDSLSNPDGVRTCQLVSSHSILETDWPLYLIEVVPPYLSRYLLAGEPISRLFLAPVQKDWDLQYVVKNDQVVYVFVSELEESIPKKIKSTCLLRAGNGTLHESKQNATDASGW